MTITVDEYDPAIRVFVEALGCELVEDSPSVTDDGRTKRWLAAGVWSDRAEPVRRRPELHLPREIRAAWQARHPVLAARSADRSGSSRSPAAAGAIAHDDGARPCPA